MAATVNSKTGVVNISVSTQWPDVSYWLATRLLERLNEFNLGRRREQAGDERRFAEELLRQREDSLRRAENRLEAFVERNRDFRSAPALALEFERLQRDVAYQLGVRNSVANTYQESRVREIRDTPTIVLVEPPRVPVSREPRGLVRAGLAGGFLGLLAAIALAVLWRAVAIQKRRGDPEAVELMKGVARIRGRFGRRGAQC